MGSESLVPPPSWRNLLKFLLPSALGCLLFLIPITYAGESSIGMGFIMDWVRLPFRGYELELITLIVTLSALGSGYFLACKPSWRESHPTLYGMLQVTPQWFGLRAAAACMCLMVYFGVGPAVLLAADTGPMLIPLIGAAVLFVLFVAYFLMPLLTDFGLLEFVGTLIRKPFEFLYTLPGRAAIDAASSIVSASSVGVILTINQYEDGRYSGREAAAVVTNFSIVSLPFCLVVAATAGIEHLFFSWYLTVLLACLACAAIMVRLPPLVNIPDDYFAATGKRVHEEKPLGVSSLRWGLQQALLRADEAQPVASIIKESWCGAWVTIFNVLGPSMLIVVAAAIMTFHTPLVDILATPVRLILEVFNLPEASKVAPGFLIGFLEMFTPAVIATQVESEQMRFVLAGLAVSQLIYMSDVGVLILRSSLPLRLRDLVVLFCLRTIILAPILVIASHLLLN